jgi:hypothetical protein
LSDLNKAFRDAYSLAASQSLADLRSRVPVFVNRFGQIALYRSGVEQPDIFSMDLALYLETRTVAHTALALHARLAPFGLGRLDAQRLDWFTTHQTLVARAAELASRSNIPDGLKAVQLEVLSSVGSCGVFISAAKLTKRSQVSHRAAAGSTGSGLSRQAVAKLEPALSYAKTSKSGPQLEPVPQIFASLKIGVPSADCPICRPVPTPWRGM